MLVAVFSLLFAACILIVGMLTGISPVTYIFIMALAAVPAGFVYMCLRTKVPKRGAIFIQALSLAAIMYLMGTIWTIWTGILLGGLLAEILSGIGKYRSFKLDITGYMVLCVSMNIGILFPAVFSKDYYLSYALASGVSPQYLTGFMNLLGGPMLSISMGATVITAALGGWWGKRILNKYFIKAGIA